MYDKQSYVYILTNESNRVLYTGVTDNLIQRSYEHRIGCGSKFTKKYQIHKLVYYDIFEDIEEAILREKQIKAGSRQDKIDLIKKMNPDFNDLYEEIIK